MGFGFFKKLKDGFKKAGAFIKNKIAKPVIDFVKSDKMKKIIGTATKFAPIIGGAIGGPVGAGIGTATTILNKVAGNG